MVALLTLIVFMVLVLMLFTSYHRILVSNPAMTILVLTPLLVAVVVYRASTKQPAVPQTTNQETRQ